MTVGIMGVNLLLCIWLFARFDTWFTRADGNDGYQFIERGVWIRSLNVEFFFGVDGVSITMVLLTAASLFLHRHSASPSISSSTSPLLLL